MKRLKLFLACMLMAVFGVGNVWADDPAIQGATLFSENFSSYSANNVPSGSVTTATGRVVYGNGPVTYTCTASGTKIYNENTGGGTAPEILVAKNGGTFVIAGIPSGDAQAITVSWTQNKQSLDVAPTGTGYSGSVSGKPANVGTRSFDITVADGADATFTLTFTGSGTSNVRVDDILVTVKTAGEGAGTPTCATPTFDPESGEFSSNSIDVEIATTTDGATIYYTTDGTNPTTSSSVYSSALNITETTTVKAMAVKTGANNSAVASATYTKVAPFDGLKLTFEVSSNPGGWPTTNPTTTTNYTYTLNSTDYTFALNNVKCNSGYLMLTSVAKLGLPAIEGYKLVKVEATNSSGCSTSTKVKITEDEAGSSIVTGGAEQTWSTTSTKYTYTLSGTEAETMYYLYVSNKNCQIVTLELYYEEVEAPLLPKAAKPTFESGDENFVTSTSVTLACTTGGAKIYYTTNGDEPTTSSTLYEGAIPVSTTTTIKAIAVADGYDKSTTAEKTFTKVEALQFLAALLEATTSTETGYNVVISDWVVTGAISNRAWISNAENTKGILLYKSGHGFTAGKKLNGVVIGTKAKLYQGYPELTSLLASEVTVSDAAEVTPRTTTLAALASGYPTEQGTLVKLENVTYAAGTGFSDGSNIVALSTQLYGATMIDGATYNIIGVVRYDNNAAISIMPRSVDDVEQISGGSLPEVDGLAELKAETVGASYLVNLTDAVVTLVSGNNAFIEDATAGALIYYSGHGLAAGDKLNGQYEVTTATYQGKFEITAMEAQTGAEKTSGAEIPETTLTIAQLNEAFAANESKRIKIVGANVTDAISGSDRNGSISDGAALAVYAGVASTITLAENDNVDIIGYPGFHNTDEQLTVWAQADITVNSSEPPVVDPRKVAESPEGGFSSVSGNLSGDEISFAAYQGGSATAPNGNNTANELRLYKYQESTNYGGYVTITAKTGCTIDQVVITVGGNCKVGYCKDAENFPTKEATPINVSTSNPFDTDKGLGASTVNVVNLDGSNQFKIKTITVYYTGEGIDLESIAISGDASVFEYTEGDAFNPAGLSVIGHYSDNSEAEITEGITWAFDPATLSITDESVSVTATVGELTSAAVVVNGLTVSAGSTPTPTLPDPAAMVIVVAYNSKYYAMSTTVKNNTGFEPVEVKKEDGKVIVKSDDEAAAIQWQIALGEAAATFQNGDDKYLACSTESNTGLALLDDASEWAWDATASCYKQVGKDSKDRTFYYNYNSGSPIFRAYTVNGIGAENYSGAPEFIAADKIEVQVPAAKADAELAFDPAEVSLTLGDDFTAPTLGSAEGFDGQALITYASSKTAVATVDAATGVVTIVAHGTTTITASFEGNDNFEAGEASYTITVNKPVPTPTSTTYTKVTSNNDLTSGEYLIVYETTSVAFDGSLATLDAEGNSVAVSINEGVIAGNSEIDAATFTLSLANGTLQSASGKYIGVSSNSNGLKQSDDAATYTHAFSIDNSGNAVILANFEGSSMKLRYNPSTSAGNLRFRYYKNDGQQAIQLYKKDGQEPTYETVRNGLTEGWYYTMCLDKAVTAVKAGSVWRVLSKAQNDKDIILEEVTGTLQAGRPYIFRAAASTLEVAYTGAAVGAPVNDDDNNGLIGSFAEELLDQNDNHYIIYENALYYVNTNNVYVGANRAYLNMLGVPDYSEPQQGAPRRRVTMAVNGPQVATGMESIQPSEVSIQKVMIDGKLFIIRGEKMFDATGRLVK